MLTQKGGESKGGGNNQDTRYNNQIKYQISKIKNTDKKLKMMNDLVGEGWGKADIGNIPLSDILRCVQDDKGKRVELEINTSLWFNRLTMSM
jgi:hypothetical protein